MFVALFYGAMGVSAGLWMWLRDRPLLALALPGHPHGLGLGRIISELAVGVALGLGAVWLTKDFERRFAWARALSQELSAVVPTLSGAQVALSAAFSSVGEELFFRGAMQDAWGPWITTALFGLSHGAFDRRLWTWSVFALVAGALFASLVMLGGTLIGAITAHALVNGLNLRAMMVRRAQDALAT